MKFSKIAAAASLSVVSLFAAGSANAAVFPDFQVTPAAYISAPAIAFNFASPSAFTADKITGNYLEVVTFNGDGTFDVSLKWNAGQFVKDDGSTPVALTGLGLGGGNGYGMYALLQGTGSFSTSGFGVTSFNLTSGSLNVYLDDYEDTTFVTPGTGASAFTRGNTGDDATLATGVVLAGNGTLNPASCLGEGINCGSFGQKTTFVLTNPVGTNFFTSPSPFFDLSFQSGQLNNFSLTGTQTINGSLDVVFDRVPEPTSLALVGLALLGLGIARRRKA